MKPILFCFLAGICVGGSAALAQSSDARDRNAADGVGIDAGENSSSQSRASVTTERDAGQNSTSSSRASVRSSTLAQDPRAPTTSPMQSRSTERNTTTSTGAERSSEETASPGRVVLDPTMPARGVRDGNGQ
ncbi:MAG: hypothetical protein M3N23_01050 [Pseudomonadota bacterium]|nr:hypothetical protein [Pseudomonadota bacterium]